MLGEEEEENRSNLFANVNTIVWQVPTSWSPSWNHIGSKICIFFHFVSFRLLSADHLVSNWFEKPTTFHLFQVGLCKLLANELKHKENNDNKNLPKWDQIWNMKYEYKSVVRYLLVRLIPTTLIYPAREDKIITLFVILHISWQTKQIWSSGTLSRQLSNIEEMHWEEE